MAYTLNPSGQPDENGVYRKFFCSITHESYPNQAVETEFENVTQAGAEDLAAALDATVQANPTQYFGS